MDFLTGVFEFICKYKTELAALSFLIFGWAMLKKIGEEAVSVFFKSLWAILTFSGRTARKHPGKIALLLVTVIINSLITATVTIHAWDEKETQKRMQENIDKTDYRPSNWEKGDRVVINVPEWKFDGFEGKLGRWLVNGKKWKVYCEDAKGINWTSYLTTSEIRNLDR